MVRGARAPVWHRCESWARNGFTCPFLAWEGGPDEEDDQDDDDRIPIADRAPKKPRPSEDKEPVKKMEPVTIQTLQEELNSPIAIPKTTNARGKPAPRANPKPSTRPAPHSNAAKQHILRRRIESAKAFTRAKAATNAAMQGRAMPWSIVKAMMSPYVRGTQPPSRPSAPAENRSTAYAESALAQSLRRRSKPRSNGRLPTPAEAIAEAERILREQPNQQDPVPGQRPRKQPTLSGKQGAQHRERVGTAIGVGVGVILSTAAIVAGGRGGGFHVMAETFRRQFSRKLSKTDRHKLVRRAARVGIFQK